MYFASEIIRAKTLVISYDRCMGYRDVRTRYFLFARIIVLVALVGIGLMIFTNIGQDPTDLTFSLLAFSIGVAALLVTILQSITVAKQLEITRKAAHDVRETGEQLKSLVTKDSRLVREIHEDIELDRDIISILEEHGVGDSAEARHNVAKHIAKRVGKSRKNHTND